MVGTKSLTPEARKDLALVEAVQLARATGRKWHDAHRIAEMMPTPRNRTRAENAEREHIAAKQIAHAAYVEAVRV